MLITDQVAIAPCTDPIPSVIPTFEAKPAGGERSKRVFFVYNGIENGLLR